MPGRDIAQRGAMCILSQIIGGEINSRMFDLLRERHGIAYSAEFDYDLLYDLGYFDMFAIVDKKQEKLAIDLLIKMQENLKKDGVTKEELTKARNFILGQTLMEEESVISQAQVISSLLTLGFDYDFYLQRENRIKDVNQDGIIHILNEYFNFEDEYLHILH
jgi:predicted Zn-dependent peptidase